ncbi:MAG: hypothetical protein B5M54_10495 [Candidatus Aminicenantes bacterium 4484_214]|nr:MAG: hypothetical protein B5M54_10495 [Candidatus Aminicenantes bacterium 4484_214]RLE08213.1 MAG: hypothetical protein DRJ06_04885 [Candidatus Aminicenantes bacterium]
MLKRQKVVYFHITFLFLFLLVVLGVNFLHTEENLRDTDNCPACQFLRSSLTTNQINFFHLPILVGEYYLCFTPKVEHRFIVIILPSSRSPPAF